MNGTGWPFSGLERGETVGSCSSSDNEVAGAVSRDWFFGGGFLANGPAVLSSSRVLLFSPLSAAFLAASRPVDRLNCWRRFLTTRRGGNSATVPAGRFLLIVLYLAGRMPLRLHLRRAWAFYTALNAADRSEPGRLRPVSRYPAVSIAQSLYFPPA